MSENSNITSLVARSLSNETVFAAPWEARAFALTLALSERGLFTLSDFQKLLIARVENFEKQSCIVDDEAYYTCWIEALGDILEVHGFWKWQHIARLEVQVIDDAASRKAHQHGKARDENGRLRIAPIVVDRAD